MVELLVTQYFEQTRFNLFQACDWLLGVDWLILLHTLIFSVFRLFVRRIIQGAGLYGVLRQARLMTTESFGSCVNAHRTEQ